MSPFWAYVCGFFTVPLLSVAVLAWLYYDLTHERKPKSRVLDFETVRRAQHRGRW